jgi:sulfonate transport system permease protein
MEVGVNGQPVTAAQKSKSIRRRLLTAVQAAAVPLLLIMLWEYAVLSEWWPRALIASPGEVIIDFGRLLASGKLSFHAMVSLRRLLGGFLIGTAAGVGLGTFVGLSRSAERTLAPTVQLLAPIPVVAWIPLFIILFGIGEASKIAIIAAGTFFVVFFNTVQGIRATDRKLVEVAYVFNKNRAQLVRGVLLPSALPSVLMGVRVALGLSWILLIVAEVIASSEGLGWLIVGMITVGILGKLSDRGVLALERRVLRWRQSFEGQ